MSACTTEVSHTIVVVAISMWTRFLFCNTDSTICIGYKILSTWTLINPMLLEALTCRQRHLHRHHHHHHHHHHHLHFHLHLHLHLHHLHLHCDSGTGASCIFPLLGTKALSWQFVASEIDPISLSSAQNNVDRNQLQHEIQIFKGSKDKLFLDEILATHNAFSFSMCNPPFFESLEETGLNRKRVRCFPSPPPSSSPSPSPSLSLSPLP